MIWKTYRKFWHKLSLFCTIGTVTSIMKILFILYLLPVLAMTLKECESYQMQCGLMQQQNATNVSPDNFAHPAVDRDDLFRPHYQSWWPPPTPLSIVMTTFDLTLPDHPRLAPPSGPSMASSSSPSAIITMPHTGIACLTTSNRHYHQLHQWDPR